MDHTKKTVRKRQALVTANQPRAKCTHRVIDAARSAAKHAIVSRALLHPIREFCIPVTKAELCMDQWDAHTPQRFYYGIPKKTIYGSENTSQLKFLRVPVTTEQQLVSYVLLPNQYEMPWKYLCCCVEYWLAMWKSWDGELKKMKMKTKAQWNKAGLVATSRRNVSTRFLAAMVARRTVVAECITNGLNDGRISSLDKFIIRNLRDWLFMEFSDLPDHANKYLEADPLQSEVGWGVYEDPILKILHQKDNKWISEGIDVSVVFKKGLHSTLRVLKNGGKEVDITYDKHVEIPDQWHERHEPPIRFISVQKDNFLRNGSILDEPLVFLYECLRAEKEIERADFLREIMDMLATNKTQYQWSLHVDQLINGELMWDEFSDLLADELHLEPDVRTNATGPGGAELELDPPFLRLDVLIAVQAYLRNLQIKPDTAANLLLQSIGQFSTLDSSDCQVWDWVIKTVKPGTVNAVLQKAHDERSKLSNVGQAPVFDQTSFATPGLESSVETCFSIVMDDHVEDAGSDGPPKILITPNTTVHTHDLDPPLPVHSSVAQHTGHLPISQRKVSWLQCGKSLDLLLTDQGRECWTERVASLYGSHTTWRTFSQSLTDSLGLQGVQRDGGMNDDNDDGKWFWSHETMDKTATRHLKEKPQEADRLFRAYVDRFSMRPSSVGMWDAMQNTSQDMDDATAALMQW